VYADAKVLARPRRTRLTYLRLLIAECSRVSVRACVCLFIGRLESTDWKQSNKMLELEKESENRQLAARAIIVALHGAPYA